MAKNKDKQENQKQVNKVQSNKKHNADLQKENTKQAVVQKKQKNPHKRFMSKVIFFVVSNIIAIIVMFVLLGELPKKALELKNLLNAQARAEASSKINIADLEVQTNKEYSDVLADIFPNEAELIEFVKTVETMEAEGLISNFTFANTQPVRDRTKILGIPVVIEFSGSWEQINTGMQRLYSTKYLLRAITVTAQPVGEEGNINFKYGGFLYVDDSFE